MGRALMIQGTASHVGKSVLVAGLCRLFWQDGLRVAPFKAQNMALNSYATADGREIGRAQAAQAEAAHVLPTADMNPILLKPEGAMRSQVVVGGTVYGVMDAATYHRRKEELWPVVEASLQRLLATYDLVVIEGAGSPVEVNLKSSDLVNMRVARAAGAPVVLVADIDRGGVFAALVGTMELLDAEERARVGGVIVNKFRGDPELFRPGVEFLEQRVARPVLGVVPWIDELGIPEEDSQALVGVQPPPQTDARLDVVVLRLPHMANFDDLDPLRRQPGVGLRFVDRPELFGSPDLVILPGTKTTRQDLAFLRERGLDHAVIAHADRGGAVLGICGGYQMLGQRIADPGGQEGPPGTVSGLGLLPVQTVFRAAKRTVQVRGRVLADQGLFGAAQGQALEAYEIHMGETGAGGMAPFALHDASGAWHPDGASERGGWVVGTYLHGLLANPGLAAALVEALGARRGLAVPRAPLAADPYDRLARVLRTHLDGARLQALIA